MTIADSSGLVEELYTELDTPHYQDAGPTRGTRKKTARGMGVAGFILGLAAAVAMVSCSPATRPAPVSTYQVVEEEKAPKRAVSFGEARNDASLRQPYIDQLVGKYGLPDYVTGVAYVDTQEEWNAVTNRGYTPDKNVQMATELDIEMKNFGKGMARSRVLVFPGAFEMSDMKSENDFKAIMFEKEFGNARAVYKGFGSFGIEKFELQEKPGVYDIDLLVSAIELYGYRGLADNIDSLTKRGISDEKRRSINLDYMVYYADLWEHGGVSKESLDFLKLEYFQPWMKRMGKSFGVATDGSWYITNTQGKRLYLPESVKRK